MAGDKSSKKKSKAKAYVNEWPSTNPSSSSRSVPEKTYGNIYNALTITLHISTNLYT